MEIGTRIGPYEVEEPLGAGGMGEVWRARDVRLGRNVALKVLPTQFAQDPDRLARFEQEAKALATLNHPNIAQVFGLERGEAAVIAMELVEGRDLSRLLAEGPLPLEEALDIARQIADALGAAHEAGIVHRDLKPANVLVRPDGVVKVLDFGLAKASGDSLGSTSGLTESPTIMSPAVTATGVIMGTAAYMAPEQAKGRPVDRRADVWALGCVLYEMLVGARPFDGEDVAEVMASVLKDPVDFEALPPSTPASIRRLLRRCFRRDPAERLDSMAAARLEIVEAGLEPSSGMDPAGGERSSGLPAWLLAAALAAGLLLGAVGWQLLGADDGASGSRTRQPILKASIPLPEGQPLTRRNPIALSHDGTAMAVSAGLDEDSRLYLRRLDSLEMEPLPGTEGALSPFFSPDGGAIGFFADGILKRISLRSDGREVTAICDAPVSTAGTWADDGWIYFLYGESRLARVRETGGEPERLGEVGDVYSVEALPGGRGVLVTISGVDAGSNRKDTATIAVLGQDGTTVTPLTRGYVPRYLASGHLVFVRAGGLLAAPFDPDRMELTGEAVSVQPGVRVDSIWAGAHFDVSKSGTLVYVAGGDFARSVPTWIDLATGAEEPLPVPADTYNNFDLSPDGTRLAIQGTAGPQDQVYVFDADRESFDRLTVGGANYYPVWSHDGREVFFASDRGGDGARVYRKPVDGSAPAMRLLTPEQEAPLSSDRNWPISVTPDGRWLMIMTWSNAGSGGDLFRAPLDGSGPAEPVLVTGSNEIIPQISPDGRWMAYLSDRTGPYRIMVRPFPEVERREWVISGSDGYDPRWAPAGDAILYRKGVRTLMRVPVGTGEELAPGVPEHVLDFDFHDSAGSSFAVSPDGRRVLLNKTVGMSRLDETPITLVTGFGGEVARTATPDGR